MWSIFLKVKKKTKEILTILFGALDIENKRHVLLFEINGFREVLKYPVKLIRKVQEMLRETAIEQITPIKITNHLSIREFPKRSNLKFIFKDL